MCLQAVINLEAVIYLETVVCLEAVINLEAVVCMEAVIYLEAVVCLEALLLFLSDDRPVTGVSRGVLGDVSLLLSTSVHLLHNKHFKLYVILSAEISILNLLSVSQNSIECEIDI